MKYFHSLIPAVLLMLSALHLVSCDLFKEESLIFSTPQSNGLMVTDMNFSQDSKSIQLSMDLTRDLKDYDLSDKENVRTEIHELNKRFLPWLQQVNPTLVSIDNVAADEIKKLDLSLLLLVDVNQDAAVLKKEQAFIKTISRLFSKDNLFLTFITAEGGISEIFPGTEYVIDNYLSQASIFRYQNEEEKTYLFRSMSTTLDKIMNGTSTALDSCRYRALVVFSNSMVYDQADNTPMDPDHFKIKQALLNQARHIPSNLTVYYVSNESEQMEAGQEDLDIMRMLCQSSGGDILTDLDYYKMEEGILGAFDKQHNDYVVNLENPDGKFYFGSMRYLTLNFYNQKDSLIASAVKEYTLGSIYDPVLIGNYSQRSISIQGVALALLLLLLIYLVFQLLIPYIRERLFEKKHMAFYTGPNMSLNSIKIPDSCYYCKAPFKIGDRIVAKCSHVMHEGCWKENGYHCPEYGRNCPEGSHYYNPQNLFDRKNTFYYLDWILMAVVAASICWFIYVAFHHTSFYNQLDRFAILLLGANDAGVSPLSPENTSIISARMYHTPYFACSIVFFLTFGISMLTSHSRRWYQTLLDHFLRALVATLLTFIVFAIANVCFIAAGIYDGLLILDCIPWTMAALIIAFFSTSHSRLKMGKNDWIKTAAVGCASTVLWDIYTNLQTVGQVMILLGVFILFAVGISLCLARFMPKSDHYFLHVNGPIKEMDIALYKWLRASQGAVVTIGKSVNCSLQLTWDLKSEIEPVHASIFLKNDTVRLKSEDGIILMDGKKLVQKKEYILYHGSTFQIGQTHFRFEEI